MQSQINKTVFFLSSALIVVITLFGSVFPDTAGIFFESIEVFLQKNTSWVYVVFVGTIMFFAFWLMFSRLGDIKLGLDHTEPEYSYTSWIAMLFSAGMGIGLLFFGVAEPVMHFVSPPVGEPQSMESAKEALKITFFHWGLHAWAIYAVFAIILAYFSYRKNLPLLPRSAFYPFIGEKIHGPIGDLVDTTCVIGTLFGVATSLGFGVAQVNAGLNYLFDIPVGVGVQVGLIVSITTLATISVVLGLDGGIKKLSNINMVLAVVLLLTILLLGNTVDLLQTYVQNTGAYLSDLVYRTFNMYAYEKKEDWIGGWTLLYWGWWVSWAPFVGMFIARISKGRTIREFIFGVLFVPSGFTFLWMTVFGNSAIDLVLSGIAPGLAEVVTTNTPVALFQFLEHFPGTWFLSMLSLCLVVTFFVSSSDSGSLVIDTLTSGGAMEPPVWQRIYWAVAEGLVAAALLLSGGLGALQTMTIASAFPMIIMISVGCLGLLKSLKADYLLLSSVQHYSSSANFAPVKVPWKDRLKSMVSLPDENKVNAFLESVAYLALEELSLELRGNGLDARVFRGDSGSVGLLIMKNDLEDFVYRVETTAYNCPAYVVTAQKVYFRADVFLRQGGQGYDIYGYSKEEVIGDALTQYEKHLHFLHVANFEQVDT